MRGFCGVSAVDCRVVFMRLGLFESVRLDLKICVN